MLELAAELGMTESRVSQLRAEALILLRVRLDATPRPLLERAAETGAPAPTPA
jgi:RNA polymerase sigma factor FliA